MRVSVAIIIMKKKTLKIKCYMHYECVKKLSKSLRLAQMIE